MPSRTPAKEFEPVIHVRGEGVEPGEYFVSHVRLENEGPCLVAYATLVPWLQLKGGTDSMRFAKEMDVLLYKAGPLTPTIWELCFILLEGKQVRIERSRKHGLFIKAIETTRG
jgi:hypothetical protein